MDANMMCVQLGRMCVVLCRIVCSWAGACAVGQDVCAVGQKRVELGRGVWSWTGCDSRSHVTSWCIRLQHWIWDSEANQTHNGMEDHKGIREAAQ